MVHPHSVEHQSAIHRSELLIHTITWMDLQGIMVSEITSSKRLHAVQFYLCNILEMTKLWKWRAESQLPGIRKRRQKGSGCSFMQSIEVRGPHGDGMWTDRVMGGFVLCLCQGGFPGCDTALQLSARLVKNLPPMQETPVRFLVWEDPLEKR